MNLIPRARCRCQLCGAEIPVMPLREFLDQGCPGVYWDDQGCRGVFWDGQGPYYFCPRHSWTDIDLWIAETLICDREHVRYLRRLYGLEVPV